MKVGKRGFGDRKDGYRVRDLDALHKIMPHIMNNRCDAEVYLHEKIDVTELLKYLEKKNRGLVKEERMTLFHAFTTAAAKIVYERPLLNRFIQGRHYYDRNEVSLSFVAKTKFTDMAEEMLIKLIAKPDDTVETIKERILPIVSKVRKNQTNQIDRIMDVVSSGPRFVTAFIVGIIKWLDFHGWLPRDITDNDPNYSTVFLTNLGSIKCNQVFHHLNNYGTNSLFIAIGTLHKEEIICDGKKKIRDIVDIGITCDERIADGFYFAKSIMLYKHILSNPNLLDEELSKKIELEF